MKNLSVKLLAFVLMALAIACSASVDTPSPTTQNELGTSGQKVMASTEGMEKPTPERGFKLKIAPTLSLSMSRNEVSGHVLQVALASCQSIAAVGAPAGVSVTLYHMPQVTTATASFSGGIVGPHYDPLVPLSTTNGLLCPGDSYVWADIAVAASVTPGNYSFAIGDLPIALQVWNLAIPAQATLPLYVGLGSFGLLAAHGLPSNTSVSIQGPLTLAYVNALRAHRIEPEGSRIADPAANSNGTMNLDNWSNFNASFRQSVMTGALAPVCVIVSSFIGTPWDTALQLQEWEATYKIEPGLANAWAYVTDEPTDIPGTVTRAQLVRTNAPDLKTMVTLEPTAQLLGLIDHFTVVFENFKSPGHWQDYTQAPGYWVYGSCESHGSCSNGTLGHLTGTPDLMLDEPDVHARLFPLVAYALGASSELYYSSNQSYGQLNPWTSQYLFGGNGDGTLFYPGVQGTMGFTDNEPVSSIRLKGLRQGQYDIEYLHMASQANLSTGFSALVQDQFHWSHSNADYDILRQQIGSALSH